MKAVITITTDTSAEAQALGGMIEVEVVEVIVAADGELLTHSLRPLLIEHSSVFVAETNERNGPRVRIFTCPPANTNTEDQTDEPQSTDGPGEASPGQERKRQRRRRRADGADE